MSEYLHGYNSYNINDIKESAVYSLFPFREKKFLVLSFFTIAVFAFLTFMFPEKRAALYANFGIKILNQIFQTVMLYYIFKSFFIKDRREYIMSFPWNRGFAGYFNIENEVPEYCYICNKKTDNTLTFNGFRRVHVSTAKEGEIVKREAPEYKPVQIKLHVCKEHEDLIKWKEIFSLSGKILGHNIFYYREATGNTYDSDMIELYKEIGRIEKLFGSLNKFENKVKEVFNSIKGIQHKQNEKIRMFSLTALLIKILLIPQVFYNYGLFNIFAFSANPAYFILEFLLLALFIYFSMNNNLLKINNEVRDGITKSIKSMNFNAENTEIMLKYVLSETPAIDNYLFKKH